MSRKNEKLLVSLAIVLDKADQSGLLSHDDESYEAFNYVENWLEDELNVI